MASSKMPALGTTELLSGNEAIARGALEAGIGVATSYAGTPASEIIGTLAPLAKKMGIYVEWSVNERAAVEVAAGASFSGIRALTAMKYNGLNVACDTVALISPGDTGKGGLVLVVADDPGGISSDNEQDTRNIAKMLEIPLLEPSSPQEAKDMIKYLFILSEEQRSICMLRTVTRVCHTRANVVLSDLTKRKEKAYFDEVYDPYNPTLTKYNPNPATLKHIASLQKLDKAKKKFELSPFNWYLGPPKTSLLIITSGTGWLYSKEAVKVLKLENKVGILKLGTISPLPEKFVSKYLSKSAKVLVVEEMDSVLERSVMEITANTARNTPRPVFYGKRSRHINAYGELNSDMVVEALARVMNLTYQARDIKYGKRTEKLSKSYIPERGMALCPGCPHRATYWIIKNALRLDGRGGVATGDIGCYQMGLLETGYFQLRTCQAMGSGIGVASGMGKLQQFGFDQPVVAVCGDSTFFHSGITGLMNGVYAQSNFTLVIVDNNATAMTGFQPHPGTGMTAMGDLTTPISIENVCRSLGVCVEICDPFDLKKTIATLLELMAIPGGPNVAIMRRECELVRARREMKNQNRMWIDATKCLGELCGCDKLCTRVFKCPALIWNTNASKAEIDEAVCAGCGVCVDICPERAIIKEARV
jgi:indolepyruvate ferredoxin oxidoreductase alpha subunit